MEVTSKRIKELRTKAGLTQEELGERLGVKKSAINKYENGSVENLKRSTIQKLSEIFKVSPAYLMGWENVKKPLPQNIFPLSTKKLPLLGEIACGQPIFADEDRESYIEVSTDINADFCLRAKGDSMINARILDGDIVFIRSQADVNNGEIAAIIVDDEATLKRVYKKPNSIVLMAENPAYSPLVYTAGELEYIHILGKAIAFQSDIF